MKAVQIHKFGEPSVLQYEEIDTPEPTDDEVRVRIHAVGVNPADCVARQGMLPIDLPWIPGWDIAGVIDEVGTDVTKFDVGDEVYGIVRFTPFPGDGGAYAEAVTVPAVNLIAKPVALSFEEAAGIPMAGLTAWRSLQMTGLESDQRVLVHAAAGGVGHFAVQFAKQRGAHVIGTASASNEEYLRDLGVDEYVNYREERFEEVLDPVDVAIDAIGGETFDQSLEILKQGGTIDNLPLNLTSEQEETADEYGIEVVQGQTLDRDRLNDITELLEAGVVAPTLDTVFPLAEAQAAHELSEEGHTRGKIILKTRP